jgi:hypothetical protein
MFTKQKDIYDFGLSCFYLLQGEHLNDEGNVADLLDQKINVTWNNILNPLIRLCLDKDPAKRPDHPLIQGEVYFALVRTYLE